MKYLLDTNTWIAYLRATSQSVIDKLNQHPLDDICLCSIVLTELRLGALLATGVKATKNKANLMLVESTYASLPFDDSAAIEAAEIKFELRKQGTPIGEFDLLIAAIARSNQITLVTHNTREFGRIPNLLIEDWQV